MKYRREVDGLRTIAVLPVILFHGGFAAFSGGFVGVDVFFVISGYLITFLIIDEIGEGRFSIRRFYERRARRILPALFFVMLTCVPFAWVWMTPSQFKDFSEAIVAVTLFSSNILFWLQTDYFAPLAELNPLLHTWSLAVEEQFYVFFPLLMIFLWRFGRARVLGVIVCLALLSLLLSEWMWRAYPAANFFLIPTRAWELGVGSICAFLAHRGLRRESQVLSALGLGLILFAIFAFDEKTPFPSLYALVPVGGAALVLMFCGPVTWTGRLLATPPMVGIGLLSYSAYLWHQPLFAFARIRGEIHPSTALILALAAASLGLAYLSWRFVEQPFRRSRGRLLPSQAAVFGASGAAIGLFMAFGLYGYVSGGMPARFGANPIRTAYLDSAKASPKRDLCHSYPGHMVAPADACQFFVEGGDVAVFGDSHAITLSMGMARVLEPEGRGIWQFSASPCAPSYRLERDDPCTLWTNETVQFIIDNPTIQNVVVAYRIYSAIGGDHAGLYPDLPDTVSDARAQQILRSFTATLEAFVAAGKTVILLEQVPEIPKDMEDLIYSAASLDAPISGVTWDWWTRRREKFDREFQIPPGVRIVNADDVFCDETLCLAGKDGVSYYFDDDHLSVAGATLVAQRVLNALSPKTAAR